VLLLRVKGGRFLFSFCPLVYRTSGDSGLQRHKILHHSGYRVPTRRRYFIVGFVDWQDGLVALLVLSLGTSFWYMSADQFTSDDHCCCCCWWWWWWWWTGWWRIRTSSINFRKSIAATCISSSPHANCGASSRWSNATIAGWEINVHFRHKNRLYQGRGFGRRFSSTRLRMADDTVTSRPRCLFVQRQPKMGKERGSSFKLLC